MIYLSKHLYVVPLNKYIKKIATLSIKNRIDEVVDEKLLYNLVGVAIENSCSNKAILHELKKIDLTRVIKGVDEVNKAFKCRIFAERSAWIYKDDNNYYRYYSRKNKSVYSLDIIDLLTVIRNEGQKEVLDFIQENWNIKGINSWYIEQRKRFEKNQCFLNEIQQNKTYYSNLNSLLKEKHWKVLEVINEFSFEKTISSVRAIDGNETFFLSNNFLKEKYFPTYSISTINNLVNLFCVLGFIRKVPFEKLPTILSDEAKVHFKKKGVLNHTSYYQVMDFYEMHKEAENIAGILLKHKLYYHRLTKRKIIELFGESFANKIYVQKVQGNREKVEPIYIKGQNNYYTESERLETLFLESIKETGKCSKSELAKTSLLSRSRFSSLWDNLIQKYHCIEKYPTKQELKKYKMRNRLLIAVPTDKTCGTESE